LTRLTYICLVSLFYLAFAGCVYIPTVPEKNPFPADLNTSIKVGVTTKEELRNILGEPDSTRQNNSVYIYANSQKIGWIIPLIPTYMGPDALDYNRNHLLIIQFTNDGIVKEINHIVGTGSQRKDGIYVADPGLRPKGHSLFGIDSVHPPFDRLLILYAPRDMDERAKKYLVPPNKSAIYVFKQHYHLLLMQAQATITDYVSLDHVQLGDFGDEGYYYWVVDPGVHYISVDARPPNQSVPAAELSIELKEGRAYFLEQTWEHTGFLGIGFRGKLTEVDKDRGEKEIGKRRLILDRFNPFE
jgi:hypothetical protein